VTAGTTLMGGRSKPASNNVCGAYSPADFAGSYAGFAPDLGNPSFARIRDKGLGALFIICAKAGEALARIGEALGAVGAEMIDQHAQIVDIFQGRRRVHAA
jgi:hypothetical protein